MGKLQFFGGLVEVKDEDLAKPKDIGRVDEDLCQKECRGRNVEDVNRGEPVFEILFTLRKYDKKVEEEWGKYEECDLIEPVKKTVRDVQPTCG